MLVLTRRVGEQVVINDDVIVTVVAVQGEKVRLGITAPASIRVDRQEVHERRRRPLVRPSHAPQASMPLLASQ